jgi:hypothetical protein
MPCLYKFVVNIRNFSRWAKGLIEK